MAEKTIQELAAELAALKARVDAQDKLVDLMTQEISLLKLAVANGGQQAGRRNLPPAEKARLKEAFMAKVKSE